jgi:hypothetical protein
MVNSLPQSPVLSDNPRLLALLHPHDKFNLKPVSECWALGFTPVIPATLEVEEEDYSPSYSFKSYLKN